LSSIHINIAQTTSEPPIGHHFFELDQTDSTNTHAMNQIQSKLAEHGNVYFAHYQTAGKGRQGKVWQAEPKANIILSVVLNASRLKLSQSFTISMVAALAVKDLLSQYIHQNISIKWPNDVYYNDSKAAGILIENKLQGSKWQWCVIGIGININQTNFNNSLLNPTSLALITQKRYDTVKLAKELCSFLETRYRQLITGDLQNLTADYNQYLYKRGQLVKFKKNNIAFNCTIQSVNIQGKLQVNGGLQDEFDFGEVEWILK